MASDPLSLRNNRKGICFGDCPITPDITGKREAGTVKSGPANDISPLHKAMAC